MIAIFFFADMYDLCRLSAVQNRFFWIVDKRYAGVLKLPGNREFHKWWIYYSEAKDGLVDPGAAPVNILNWDG